MNKILVIEDHRDIRENISEILELDDYEVVQAENGKQGVELALSENPDLILCDIMMPELDGYGVLHILSKKASTMNIPFVFLSAKADKIDVRKGMTLGADDYITKPFDDTELLDVIDIRIKKANSFKNEYKSDAEGLKNFISDANSLDDLLEINRSQNLVHYKKKEDIFHSGEIPHQLYFVVSGKVKTQKMSIDGKELITEIYSEGDFFGYEAILSESKHTNHAKAFEDSTLITISKKDFFQLIYSNKQIAKKFIEMLSKKVVQKEENLLILAYSSVRQRTAETLISIHKKFNQTNDENSPIKISREELSNIIGTATETVIRVISEFKEEGLIDLKFGKIVINSIPKLEQISKWNFSKRR